MRYINRLAILVILVTSLLLNCDGTHAEDLQGPFEKLVLSLHADGLDQGYLDHIFSHPEINLIPRAVAKSLIRREAELNYSQFLEKYSIERGVTYLENHKEALKSAEDRFQVSAPIIVAILSVETACGTYTGRFFTINILVTQALSLEPVVFRSIYAEIPPEERSSLTKAEIKQRLSRKSSRAYRELKAVLRYVKNHEMEPFKLKGSIEGAIGFPQFLPSNIEKYGFDGNRDNVINLFHHEDAIASIARYLSAHNWQEEDNYNKKKKVILKYNHSDYYASTILKLAGKLKSFWHQLAPERTCN